jgi:hypothetical protein
MRGRDADCRRRSRPSVLDEVRLSDGRLAWPVARSNGVREVVFRMRLHRGWPADRAALSPVVQRSPARSSGRCRCGRPAVEKRPGVL